MKLNNSILWLFTCMVSIGIAQQKKVVILEADAWEIEAKNHAFKKHLGKHALFLEEGKARAKGAVFKTGIIEFDVSFEQIRNFVGVHFRILDKANYEEYYLRPHQSGNPDAMQYTPVFNGNAGWQLYTGVGHWAAKHFNFGQWMHVKLIVADNRADVFIDDMETPVLHIKDLKGEHRAGGLGFGTFLGSAYFANLTYEAIENPKLTSKSEDVLKTRATTIRDWKVSKAFAADALEGIQELKELDVPADTPMEPDALGILNLSKVAAVGKETNTLLAKVLLESDKDQLKRMDFGYSDQVTVFVNGKPVYFGDNSFKSRDYRYLGSVGYFDSVFLELEKGSNEVVFALTERMGGWGIMARLPDLENLRVK